MLSSLTDDNDVPTRTMDALHCSVGCFHALLSVLQAPLTSFVASYRQRTDLPPLPPEVEAQNIKLFKTGLRKHLQFVRDQWDNYFSLEISASVLRDVKTLLGLQTQSLYKPYSSSTPYDRGVEATMRLLLAVGATKNTVRLADAIVVTTNALAYRELEPSEVNPTKQQPKEQGESPGAVAEPYDEAFSLSSDVAEAHSDTRGDGIDVRVDSPQNETSASSFGRPTSVTLSEFIIDTTEGRNPSRSIVKKPSKELRAARSCVELQEFEEAVYWIDKELVRTKKRPHTHASLYAMRSQCRYEVKEFQQAYDDAQKALAIDKNTVDAYRWASAALVKLDRLSDAHSTCSAGRKTDPTHEPLKALEKEISRKALAASKMNRASAMSTTTSLSGSSDQSQVSSAKMVDQKSNWKETLQAGVRLTTKSDLVAAHAAFTEALRLIGSREDGGQLVVGSCVKVLGHRARCRLSMNQFQLAIDDARDGLGLKPDWLEGHRLLCKGFIGLKQWEDALAECTVVLRGCPQDVAFLNFEKQIMSEILPKGDESGDSGDEITEGAVEAKDSQQSDSSTDVESKELFAAKSCIDSRNFERGVYWIEQELIRTAAEPHTHPRLLVMRARCHFEMGQRLFMIRDCQQAVAIDRSVDAYMGVCHGLMSLGLPNEAYALCGSGLKHHPLDERLVALEGELNWQLYQLREDRCWEHDP